MRFRTIAGGVLLSGAIVVMGGSEARATLSTEHLSDSTPAVVDGSSVTRTMVASNSGTVAKVVVTGIEFAKISSITGFGLSPTCGPPPATGAGLPWNSELSLALRSPAGTSVTLVAPGAMNPRVYGGQVTMAFDDAATSALPSFPATGTFKPSRPLAAFVGEPAAGTWELIVTDQGRQDPLCFYSATVDVITGVPDATLSGPATITEGAGTATYTVSLNLPAQATVTVPWTVSAGSASVPGDAGPASGSVTIPAGQSSGTFTVGIVDDNLFEGDETYTVMIGTPTGPATLGADTTLGTTITDDETPPKATISGPASIDEAAGAAAYTVALSGPTTQPVTVPVSLVPGTATTADAYTLVATMTIPAGQTTATFPVTIVNDLLQENAETYTMVMGAPTGPAVAGATTSVATTIIDNGDRPSVEVSGLSSVDEADGAITYTVVLSTPSLHDVTVPYTVVGGTATVPGDAGPASGSVTIPAGQLSATFTVTIVNDTLAEADETFTVTLGTPSPAMPLGPTHAVTTTIIDDDVATPPPPGAPTISITGTTVTEGTGPADTLARLTVTLDHAAAGPVTVQYRTRPGTATPGVDYRTTRATLTIPAGATTATITIPVIADNKPEPDETLRVILSRPTSATLGTTRLATLTITNDDRSSRTR